MTKTSRIKGDRGEGRLKGREKIVGKNLRQMKKNESEKEEAT
jgi:hypothetical protein